ncbi:MAG: hypothetical protein ABSA05_13415 [Opitutaceae bacterium]|jgi:hypothetical protein
MRASPGLAAGILAFAFGFGVLIVARQHERRANEALSRVKADARALDATILSRLDKPAAPRVARANRPPPAVAIRTPRQPGSDNQVLYATNPEVRAAYIRSFVANFPVRYLPLIDRLHLTPGISAALEQLLAGHEEDRLDAVAMAALGALPPNDSEIAGIQAAEDAQLAQSERQLLGAEGYAALQAFNQAQPLQPLIDRVALASAWGTSPLSASQMEQLFDFAIQATPAPAAGTPLNPLTQTDWSAVAERAKGTLTPTQLSSVQMAADLRQVMNLVHQYYASPAARP